MLRDWDLEEAICEYFQIEIDSIQEELIVNICKWLDADTMNRMLQDIATNFQIYKEDE